MTVALMISALSALALSSGIALAAALPPQGDEGCGDWVPAPSQDRSGRR